MFFLKWLFSVRKHADNVNNRLIIFTPFKVNKWGPLRLEDICSIPTTPHAWRELFQVQRLIPTQQSRFQARSPKTNGKQGRYRLASTIHLPRHPLKNWLISITAGSTSEIFAYCSLLKPAKWRVTDLTTSRFERVFEGVRLWGEHKPTALHRHIYSTSHNSSICWYTYMNQFCYSFKHISFFCTFSSARNFVLAYFLTFFEQWRK